MINLLPYNRKAVIKQMFRMRVINAALLSLFFLCVTGFLLTIPSFISVDMRSRVADEAYAALAQKGSFVDEAELETAAQAVSVLKQAYSAEGIFPVLTALESLQIPPGITVTKISFESNAKREIGLSGTTLDRSTLQAFIAALGMQEGVRAVDSPVSNFVKNQNSEFSITVMFK